ncbi:TlpA disulfide reductase family protein [Pseudorhodoferax sp. Leaf267]|uniref:TlpA family protein disulfide reductase n=1 Tax=Pseudorhodoferax sp. Leaf267 TaxID=1736316 RepID=UPI0006FD9A6B|nr:TlpA disulfide reductase family protein [Pseudorhodoferax sp. Leaf267]KQP15136.1 thiol-disulfide isomerase [Pseudorhodoferax sp. Leaf267]
MRVQTRRSLLLAGLAASLPARAQHEVTAWSARTPFPAIEALDLDGKTWRLADLKGRAVLLNFWASWCEPCRAEMPTLQQLADLYGDDRLAVLALNFKESAPTALRFVQRTGLRLPVLLDRDGAIARDCGVRVFPSTVLIAPDGRPRQRVRGELDWTGREAGALVQALLEAPRPTR